ncbi:MAG: AAA family ATPase [Deltaproteobacteria bacterium]|nr:AAA family ATPase [Deltaproteobacteria bacterium]
MGVRCGTLFFFVAVICVGRGIGAQNSNLLKVDATEKSMGAMDTGAREKDTSESAAGKFAADHDNIDSVAKTKSAAEKEIKSSKWDDALAKQSSAESAAMVSQVGDEAALRVTVVPKKEASPKISSDPVLLEIESQLQQLILAKLPATTDVQVLFDVPLDDVGAIGLRIGVLKEERGTQRSSRQEKEKRLSNLLKEFPEPQIPSSLLSTLEMPVAPEPPAEPVKPDVRRPRGKLTAKRPRQWLDAYNSWLAYDDAIVAHAPLMEKYGIEMEVYEKALGEYENAVAMRNGDRATFESAMAKNQQKIASMRKELRQDVHTIALRSRILNLRLKYLEALHEWMSAMTAPARTALVVLKQRRKPLWDTMSMANRLDEALATLAIRLETLANRADAGSMAGFQIKLSQLSGDLRQMVDAVQQRQRNLQTEKQSLVSLRTLLRSKSTGVRNLIFLNVFHPRRDRLVDDAFLSYLGDMRKTADSWFLRDFSLKSGNALIDSIGQAVKTPADVTTYSEGMKIVAELKTLVEKLDVQIDELGLLREHQKQIFRREAVSVLSSLATQETRSRAYSFSHEILADLSSDFYSLKSTVQEWFTNRKAAVINMPQTVRTKGGILLIVRVFAAITLLILTGLLGRRLSHFVRVSIRRLSRGALFRNRPGQLMRYAGVIEAILPTVLVGATLYAALAIIGFSTPEVRFTEVVLRWLILYRLGEKVLIGLTHRVSRGRPAFIPVSSQISDMLLGTYRKLGLVWALAAILLEWAAQWFGSGIVHTLIVHLMWGWMCIWGLWALMVWRPVLADALIARYTVGAGRNMSVVAMRLFGAGNWMRRRWSGALLTAPVALLLSVDWLFRQIRYLLYEGGIVTFFRARFLRRLVKTQKKNSVAQADRALPELYTRAFPLYPIYDETDAVILPRKKSVEEISKQIEKWTLTQQDSSVVVLGEKGVGKTTLLTLLEQELEGNVIRHSIGQKLKSEKALVAELAGAFGIEDCAPVVGAVAAFLNKGEQRVILVDECHNMFLRTVDGYEAYEAMIRLVNVTSQKVFWVLVFNSFSFAFLNASKRRLHYFRKLHTLPTWSRDDLFDLISKRNRQSGFEIEFDEVLLDANRSATGDFEVIEGAEGFFRLLWENSGGNPRVATCLWLDALTAIGESKIRVGIFSESLAWELSKMDVELLYTLAAICQHENLSVSELREVLNVSTDFANFAIRFLSEYGLVETKHTDARRHTLAPRFYPQMIKLLRSHHLLYEKE